jgi:hypothetical protein
MVDAVIAYSRFRLEQSLFFHSPLHKNKKATFASAFDFGRCAIGEHVDRHIVLAVKNSRMPFKDHALLSQWV